MLKLFKILTYFQFFSLNQIKIYGDKNYCGPNFCNDSKEHVLCKFQLDGPARHCIKYERTIKSSADKQLVLDKINSRRNKVAAGEIRSLYTAENMMTMVWSDELATSAQRWADQCVGQSIPDSCRDLNDTSVGQNIATIYDDAPGLTPSMLVDLWYIEVLNVNSSIIRKYQRPSITESNHYEFFTQLIWAESTRVGCGAVKFKERIEAVDGNKNRTVYRLVCNFASAGNLIGKSVYTDGLPCSRCPLNGACDSVYKSLCGQVNTTRMKSEQYRIPVEQKKSSHQNSVLHTIANHFTTKSNKSNFNKDSKNDDISWPERSSDYDDSMSFDFFTDLFEVTTKSSTHVIDDNTTVCKDILIVDELFNLLKRKLNNDQTLRELLLTSKTPQSGNTEDTFTDPSIADILSHIYTTKESTTTTKTTNEYLNSTLLVDLVEAVIFRKSDKYSTSAIMDMNNQSVTEVNAVKIRAELGATRSNSDFTGHYFFPEDNNDETNSDKETDNYYDMTELSTSDVGREIEDLRRNKGTKDFLEEILDSDFVTETVAHLYITSDNPRSEGNKYMPVSTKKDVELIKKPQIVRKRRNKDGSFVPNYNNINTVRKRRRLLSSFVNYSDLLRQLAADLEWLKLGDMFHCSHYNSAKKAISENAVLTITSILLTKLNVLI